LTTVLFFFTEIDTTKIKHLSLHDALPISNNKQFLVTVIDGDTFTVDVDATDFGSYTAGGQIFERKFYRTKVWKRAYGGGIGYVRSEEHTSELQSRENLVCRLLLEKKKKQY